MKDLYTPEQMKQFEELRQDVSPADIQTVEQSWTTLLAEVRANRHLDPASPEAQALADRWNKLIQETARHFQSKTGLWETIGENYRQGRVESHERAPQVEDFAFIQRENQTRHGTSGAGAD